jgi:DNA mismatch repair ATPase MutS
MTTRAQPFRQWLEQHLEDAQKEYARIQAIEEEGDDPDLYERVHQMWGYLSGLEKCLKELKAR